MSNTHALRTAALGATTSKQAVTFSMETTQFPIRATPRATSEQESLVKRGRGALPAAYPKTPEGLQRLEDGIKALGAKALGQRHGVSKDAVVKLRQRRRKELAVGVPALEPSSEPQPQLEGVAAAEGGLPHLVESQKPIYNDNKGWCQIVRGLATESSEKVGYRQNNIREDLKEYRNHQPARANDGRCGSSDKPMVPVWSLELVKQIEAEFAAEGYTDSIHIPVAAPTTAGWPDYAALREAATRMAGLGLSLQTVIPMELPAKEYPLKRKNKRTGQWEIQLSKDGNPLPDFIGKNPSYWQVTGVPKKASHSKPIDVAEVMRRLNVAESQGKPIGLAVIPSTDVVVIDLDRKDYPSQEALDADLLGLLDRHPELTATRIERTPGGGVHIYVKVVDGMASWRTETGKLRCNFTTVEGGPHRGEILAGTRVSVCAPTRNGAGRYELFNPDHAYDLVEINSLGAIGIHPSSSAAPRPSPPLGALLGGKAKAVLKGEHPYASEGDRSAQLTGFVKEVFSWVNLLTAKGLVFSGSADDLIQQAVAVLEIEDKADRVLDSIDPSTCRKQDPDVALRIYRKFAGESQATGDSTTDGVLKGAGRGAVKGKLSLQEAILQALDEGLSGSELSFRLDEIASDFSRSPRDVQGLHQQLAKEREAEFDTADALDQLERLSVTASLDVRSLIPPSVVEALEGMRAFAEYRYDVLLAVLLAGLSAALPLKSEIELNRMEDFRQPLTLWVLLLMPSGELKSPLLKRLLLQPWEQSVDVVVKEAYERKLEEWKLQSEQGDASPGPKPRLPKTLVMNDATTPGMEVHMELHDKWANRSMCIWLDEGKEALRQMVDPGGAGKDVAFGGWLLSRFDGTGARGAKVDQSRERDYKSCRLALLSSCQPDVYREITGDGDQTGLSARFIVVEQPMVTQHFPTSLDASELQRADDLHSCLLRCYDALAKTDELRLWLSPEAFVLFQTERQAMHDRKRASLSSAERALANKSAGRIGRLAALFHILWRVAGTKGISALGKGGEVGADSMQRAIIFSRYLLDQTVGVRLTSADNSEQAGLMLRLQRVAWEKHEPVTLGQLRKAFSGKRRPEAAEVLQALQELERRGFGLLEPVDYQGQQSWKYIAHKPLMEAGS